MKKYVCTFEGGAPFEIAARSLKHAVRLVLEIQAKFGFGKYFLKAKWNPR